MNISIWGVEMFRRACEKGDLGEVKTLLEKGDPADNNNEAIRSAAYLGHTDMVKMLLQDNRVNPADQNNYAIRWAANYGHTDTVKILVQDNRVNPADENNEAIKVAAEYGHTDTVKILLQDPRVNPEDENNYAIQWAANNGHTDTVKTLLMDRRVEATKGIVCARKNLARWFIQTHKHGYYKHKNMYDKHQQDTVKWFMKCCEERMVLLGGLKWTLGRIKWMDMYYDLKKIIKKRKFK